MSRLTTRPLLIYPPSSTTIALPSGGPWTAGAWTEILASVTATMVIAGVVVEGPYATMQNEIEFGLGAPGAETAIGYVRLFGPNSGNSSPSVYQFPLAISEITAGQRLSARAWNGGVGMTLLYYEAFDSDQIAPYATFPMIAVPPHGDSASITPNATPWNNSAWAELSPALPKNIWMGGVAFSNPIADVHAEFDLGKGAAGAEVVLTTVRTSTPNQDDDGRLWFINLPGLYPVAQHERLVTRMRYSGSATTPHLLAVIAYEVGEEPPPPGCPGILGDPRVDGLPYEPPNLAPCEGTGTLGSARTGV